MLTYVYQELVTGCNVYLMNDPVDKPKFLLLNKAALYIAKIFRILGIDDNTRCTSSLRPHTLVA